MANWFYLAGSIYFAVGTILNMLPSSKPLRIGDFGQYHVMTPEEAARNLVPLTQNNASAALEREIVADRDPREMDRLLAPGVDVDIDGAVRANAGHGRVAKLTGERSVMDGATGAQRSAFHLLP